ncbi:hypothetical protein CYMTET_4568, partial [Cymbomonas tetramitiformis]
LAITAPTPSNYTHVKSRVKLEPLTSVLMLQQPSKNDQRSPCKKLPVHPTVFDAKFAEEQFVHIPAEGSDEDMPALLNISAGPRPSIRRRRLESEPLPSDFLESCASTSLTPEPSNTLLSLDPGSLRSLRECRSMPNLPTLHKITLNNEDLPSEGKQPKEHWKPKPLGGQGIKNTRRPLPQHNR